MTIKGNNESATIESSNGNTVVSYAAHATIKVKVLPATTHKGTRYKASTYAGETVTVPMDYALGFSGNCCAAAAKLIAKLGWNTGAEWKGGHVGENSMVFLKV